MKLLFASSTFYKEYTKEMLQNALSFFEDPYTKTIELNSFTRFFKDGKQVLTKDVKDLLPLEENFFKLSLTHKGEEVEITFLQINGSLELPQAVSFALKKEKYEGICTFGIVKKGQTSHDYFVTKEAHEGLSAIALSHNIPLTNAIINAESEELIKKRTSASGFNVGLQAVTSCMQLIELKKIINLS